MRETYTPPPEWWPLESDEPIGLERAQELVAYLKVKMPKAMAVADEWLADHFPNQTVNRSPQSASQLAKASLGRRDCYLHIGQLSIGTAGLLVVQVMIFLDRWGRIVLSFRKMQPANQRSWTTVGAA